MPEPRAIFILSAYLAIEFRKIIIVNVAASSCSRRADNFK